MRNELEIVKQSLEEVKREFGHLSRQKMTPGVRKHLIAIWEQFRTVYAEVATIQKALDNPFLYPEGQYGDGGTDGDEAATLSLGIDTSDMRPAGSDGETHPKPALVKPSPLREPGPSLKTVAPDRGSKVLVIDDCENTQNILSYTLQKRGFQIASLTDPTKSMAKVLEWQPDLILLDLMMPQMDGFEVLKMLRANPTCDDIQIIVGSSRSYDKDRLTVLGLGANDFIAKPYNVKELGLRIRNFLSARLAPSIRPAGPGEECPLESHNDQGSEEHSQKSA